ncbi:type III polyketide synthase [Mucilaginibacter sp. OK283]|jgi:predicted naringenin-chalcone synthase|uniref:type III polyketide synthase n=1 Tax=Mucilaginibacter sp. OK283 TaxID=1881049 RepID=UPI0008D2E146|nr:type III polyketide synthase [Mucilaginibacter sp. OK283]SEO08336.1 Predicted naringenin-chalcone synthase [Mucilaginibacter sp. OK283]
MESCISAIGIANPHNRIAQQDIYHFMVNAFGLDATNAARLKSIYDNSGIDYRYSVIPDFGESDPSNYTFFDPSGSFNPFPDTRKRLKLYQDEAIAIAINAVKNCLAGFGADALKQITHLVTISCTGMHAPGIDIELVEKLELNRDTERTCINFMGCYGAINGLKVADYICRANPEAKVLVVSVELCTLHFQKDNTLDNWVANSLFSDGAAAVLVENSLQRMRAGTNLILKNFYSEFVTEARDDMGWYVGNTGFEMKLTSRVSKQIKKNIKALTGRFLQKVKLNADEITAYAVHPGGRKILEAVEEALELPEESNAFAYETLQQYGNMSSATILFVLQKMLKAESLIDQKVMSFAFGPGLTVEGMILEMSC